MTAPTTAPTRPTTVTAVTLHRMKRREREARRRLRQGTAAGSILQGISFFTRSCQRQRSAIRQACSDFEKKSLSYLWHSLLSFKSLQRWQITKLQCMGEFYFWRVLKIYINFGKCWKLSSAAVCICLTSPMYPLLQPYRTSQSWTGSLWWCKAWSLWRNNSTTGISPFSVLWRRPTTRRAVSSVR